MTDSRSAPRTDMAAADAADGEPDALDQATPADRHAAGGRRDDEQHRGRVGEGAAHPAGEEQARENRENEPPA